MIIQQFDSDKPISDGFIQSLVGAGLKPAPTSDYHYQQVNLIFKGFSNRVRSYYGTSNKPVIP